MIRTQISVDKNLYERARRAARRRGISLAEICRYGLREIVAREPGDRPWMSLAGVLQGGRRDSASVDSVVYDRPEP